MGRFDFSATAMSHRFSFLRSCQPESPFAEWPGVGFYSWSRTLVGLWAHMDGRTGLVQLMTVNDRLLQGQGEIWDLITYVLPDLLQAILAHMQAMQMVIFLQSLNILFDFLVYEPLVMPCLACSGSSRHVSDKWVWMCYLIQYVVQERCDLPGIWPTGINALTLCTLLRAKRSSLRKVLSRVTLSSNLQRRIIGLRFSLMDAWNGLSDS